MNGFGKGGERTFFRPPFVPMPLPNQVALNSPKIIPTGSNKKNANATTTQNASCDDTSETSMISAPVPKVKSNIAVLKPPTSEEAQKTEKIEKPIDRNEDKNSESIMNQAAKTISRTTTEVTKVKNIFPEVLIKNGSSANSKVAEESIKHHNASSTNDKNLAPGHYFVANDPFVANKGHQNLNTSSKGDKSPVLDHYAVPARPIVDTGKIQNLTQSSTDDLNVAIDQEVTQNSQTDRNVKRKLGLSVSVNESDDRKISEHKKLYKENSDKITSCKIVKKVGAANSSNGNDKIGVEISAQNQTVIKNGQNECMEKTRIETADKAIQISFPLQVKFEKIGKTISAKTSWIVEDPLPQSSVSVETVKPTTSPFATSSQAKQYYLDLVDKFDENIGRRFLKLIDQARKRNISPLVLLASLNDLLPREDGKHCALLQRFISEFMPCSYRHISIKALLKQDTTQFIEGSARTNIDVARACTKQKSI